MKVFKYAFGFLFSIFLTLGITNVLAASSMTGQFGGRIITTTLPPVTCSSQYGIITMLPAKGSELPGPFIIESTSKSINAGGQILGLYEKTPDFSTCYIQAGPYRIPVPTYKIKKTFNSSKR
jgi:hypothetical protein